MKTNKMSVIVILLVILIINYVSTSNVDENAHKMQSDIESVLSHMRMVVKNGIKVKGTYSYTDGQFRKTIYYIADNKGYRITGEDIVPVNENIPLRFYPQDKFDESEVSQETIQGSDNTNPSTSSRTSPTSIKLTT